MSEKLDWLFSEDGFEDLDRQLLKTNAPTSALAAPSYGGLERNPQLLRLGIRSRFSDRVKPEWLFLSVSLVLFGSLTLLYFCI